MVRRIDFIGIGAQKSGTTWIHRILHEHPEICVAIGKDKDTRFFSCLYDHGYEWYHENFKDCLNGKRLGEVSTSYFYHTDCPPRIHSYRHDIKLFVCFRNPVERIISNHKHEVRAGHVSGDNRSLSVAIENNPAYIEQSLYASQLKKWYDCFERNQIHIIIFDDIVNDPESVVRNLYTFLDVDVSFQPDLFKKENVSLIPENQSLDRMMRTMASFARTTGMGKLVDFSRELGINDWFRKKNSVENVASTYCIDDDTVSELYRRLFPEVNKLSEMIDRDLTFWIRGDCSCEAPDMMNDD